MTQCFVLMGVSGCGKTSLGVALSEQLAVSFIDGDDLHPQSNIDKMASGQALNDDDRAPWLAKVGSALADADGPVAIGCSALKRMYRDQIRNAAGKPVSFLHLDAPKHVLQKRVTEREGHFMPPALLDSQFAALEPLQADEFGTQIDISKTFPDVLEQSVAYVRETLA